MGLVSGSRRNLPPLVGPWWGYGRGMTAVVCEGASWVQYIITVGYSHSRVQHIVTVAATVTALFAVHTDRQTRAIHGPYYAINSAREGTHRS